MSTVGNPGPKITPQVVLSPTLAAGSPSKKTVPEPAITEEPLAIELPKIVAGIPPIRTVAAPLTTGAGTVNGHALPKSPNIDEIGIGPIPAQS